MDIDNIRSQLDVMRGQWSRVADRAGINRKTVERLMHDQDYNPTLGTLKAISGAISVVRGEAEAKAA